MPGSVGLTSEVETRRHGDAEKRLICEQCRVLEVIKSFEFTRQPSMQRCESLKSRSAFPLKSDSLWLTKCDVPRDQFVLISLKRGGNVAIPLTLSANSTIQKERLKRLVFGLS